MNLLDSLVLATASVTLFLYGLQSFSKELQSLSEGPLKKVLAFATRNRVIGAFTGAATTAVLQSSSAVSALAVALTNSGLLSLRAVLPVLIGANVGTASTAFLVSWKVQGVGTYFLLLGSILSLLPLKIRVIGKTVFYFGFILFALDLIGGALKPFYGEPWVKEWLEQADWALVGILAGLVLTAVLQSSSVLTGIVVLLAGQELISLSGAIAVVLGANIGTTATALIASIGMGRTARAAALANLVVNVIGVSLAYFLISPMARFSLTLGGGTLGVAVAWAHLLFNIGVVILFLLLLTPTYHLITLITGLPRDEAS